MQNGSQIFFTTIIFHFSTFRYSLLGEKLTEKKTVPVKIRTLFWSFISNYIPGFETEVQNIFPDRGYIPVCLIYWIPPPPPPPRESDRLLVLINFRKLPWSCGKTHHSVKNFAFICSLDLSCHQIYAWTNLQKRLKTFFYPVVVLGHDNFFNIFLPIDLSQVA